ncbi:MAG: DNRLRE domain-containing protein [Gemmataceae bacterium]|nr:DNRLRE domain-containing protein [Gemmata sp.]MDW8198558.1 DNRLRE domain-containing protein [Gemmataceae bacterium]
MKWMYALVVIVGVGAGSFTADTAPSGVSHGKQILRFQEGVNGYKGTIDLEIWAVSPNTCLNGNPNASSDADNDGGESQVLVRFENIIGHQPGQIPPHSAVHSAIFTVSAFDEGTTVHLHRMLVPWKATATWNSLVAGVTADGLEASRQKDGFTFGKISASSSFIDFDVTDTVQAWVNGKPNYGWVFINTGGNGWDFYTSEFEDVQQRPKLVVEFTPPKTQK